jgi:hypothetical protein
MFFGYFWNLLPSIPSITIWTISPKGTVSQERPCNINFKGSLTRDFRLQVFFMNPRTSKYSILFCRWHRWTSIAGDNNAGDKLIAGDNDTSEQSSPVTTTPAINLLPVRWQEQGQRTPWRWGAADGVIETAMKSCIHRHPTHPEAAKLNITVWFEVVLAASPLLTIFNSFLYRMEFLNNFSSLSTRPLLSWQAKSRKNRLYNDKVWFGLYGTEGTPWLIYTEPASYCISSISIEQKTPNVLARWQERKRLMTFFN